VAVHIVVDSTSDLDPERARANNITVVPLKVAFGDDVYRDGIDIDNQTFYARMAKAPVLPVTSTPPIDAFQDAYTQAVANGATGILSIHLSGALSGTLNTAMLAAQQLKDAGKLPIPIELVDSRTVSAGFGYPALLAAQKARDGASLADLKTFVDDLFARGKTYFVLDTLENLKRGGRIGAASAIFGTMLSIKPILAIKDGQVVPLERVRSRSKALARVGELVQALGPIEYMALARSDDVAGAELAAAITPIFSGHIEYFELGAVIGTHAGPHAAGLFVTPKQS
jgi:DegV family protein with EDD domain